jgi:hypothetical protein
MALFFPPQPAGQAEPGYNSVRRIATCIIRGTKATIYSTCIGGKYSENPSYNGATIQVNII